MARMVRCSITNEVGNSSDFIKIGRKYYKNQEVYDKYKADKEIQDKLMSKIAELLGYKNGIMIGTTGGFVMKKIKESILSKDELYNSLI